ncbi:DUF4197 domain-containing protein [Segetibacter koreensis]|uniref:DUF4197 domain-containing protein n=1 Tax=Segetibacter koreensis TaxID=398037 RepID=UPI00037BE349|nr:DUF4197 domain-containing protein [Segetibacter koreensis]
MKKVFLPFLFIILLPLTYSCGTLRYTLNQNDAADAIRQLLSMGARDNNVSGAFSKETILATLFPEPVHKVLNTLNTLGLTSEIDRFTTTLSSAAEKTATASIPIFENSIRNMKFSDAIHIIKSGGTAATDYLRVSSGDTLRSSIRPIMLSALEEYKLNEQWNNIVKPAKAIAGNKLNLDLGTLMAGAVSEAMFRKIAEREVQVRKDASARTTSLLKKVFSGNYY